jgi:hypothetical protein
VRIVGVVVGLVALVVPGAASAVPPVVTSVGSQARHVTATFSAPRADSVTVYIASKPDRATDGSFLQENIEGLDILTDSEIQAGRWIDEDQTDPGTHWVMLRASPDFDSCYILDAGGFDPACADGYSSPVQVVVPRPATRYVATSSRFIFLRQLTLTLTARPLGEDQAYRVCYRTAAKGRRCVRGRLDGYSWNAAATDDLTISTRGLAAITMFQWFVGTRVVVQKRIRVR